LAFSFVKIIVVTAYRVRLNAINRPE